MSVSGEAGSPWAPAAPWNVATTSAALNTVRGRGGDQQPGMVILHVQDPDLGAAGEAPVGDVGLPPLVRHRGLVEPERVVIAAEGADLVA